MTNEKLGRQGHRGQKQRGFLQSNRRRPRKSNQIYTPLGWELVTVSKDQVGIWAPLNKPFTRVIFKCGHYSIVWECKFIQNFKEWSNVAFLVEWDSPLSAKQVQTGKSDWGRQGDSRRTKFPTISPYHKAEGLLTMTTQVMTN